MKSRLTGGNNSKFEITLYTIGTLISILSVGICAHTMYKYGIEFIMMALMVTSAFMIIVGIDNMIIEIDKLHSNTDKY